MESDIAMISDITGATAEVARYFLNMTDGDVQQAIQLFFDSPDLSSGITQDPPVQPLAQSSRTQGGPITIGRTDSAGVVHIDSDEEDGMAVDEDTDIDDRLLIDTRSGSPPAPVSILSRPAAYEDDEALARRMQEELYAGGDMSADYDAHGVRAPMARTTETLVGPGADWMEDDVHPAVLEQMRSRINPRRQGRPGVFNQHGGSSSIWEENDPVARREALSMATGGASEFSSKAAKLAELFRPPFELMTRLPWDDARQKGKDEEKWILVNVQNPAIFDCQALNRDIWKDDGVKETVKENFIFMQYDKDDPRASQYVQYYFQAKDSDAAYPHIAIVDPRTGEQVKVWSGPPGPKAMDFLMQLHEFLDRYSLNVAVKNPVAKRKPEKSASLDVDRLTEEQMLDLALQNSLANGHATGPKEHDPDDLTKSIDELGKGKGNGKGKGKEIQVDIRDLEESSTNVPGIENSAFALISSTNPHVEPPNDPATTTRIQFRHSSGRVIKRFTTSDPVRRIYEWLKSEPIEGKADVDFELKSMGKDLIDSLNLSIAEAGLKNGTVMVEYLED